MTRTQPPQQPPPVQRVRVQYAKEGPVRFASHRDLSRVLERALRRADVPMAYSSGFNPHPRVSYAGAAPTGAASRAEYLELALCTRVDPERLRVALNSALPSGCHVVRVVESEGRSLRERLVASHWQIRFPGVAAPGLAAACVRLLARSEVLVSRMTKNGERSFDVRPAIVRLVAEREGVQAVLRHGEPLVRPDDLAAALLVVWPGLLGPEPVILANRLAQGPLVGDEVGDPLVVED